MKLLPLLLLMIATPLAADTPPPALGHERLRLRNTFKTPEEVVSYYCARDASGFVWSGLLDAERRAFTVWREPPQHDSFLIAKRYEVLSVTSAPSATPSNEVQIQVRYDIVGMGDANGSRSPAPRNPLVVTFSLKRVDGNWKIIRPDPAELSPVVLESKFFTGGGTSRTSLPGSSHPLGHTLALGPSSR